MHNTMLPAVIRGARGHWPGVRISMSRNCAASEEKSGGVMAHSLSWCVGRGGAEPSGIDRERKVIARFAAVGRAGAQFDQFRLFQPARLGAQIAHEFGHPFAAWRAPL